MAQIYGWGYGYFVKACEWRAEIELARYKETVLAVFYGSRGDADGLKQQLNLNTKTPAAKGPDELAKFIKEQEEQRRQWLQKK